MKKIIFLDFDGVLNSEMDYTIQVEYLKKPIDEREDISERAINCLNSLIESTGAEVVVSSTWRIGRTVEELQQLLERHGFKGKVIGVTPSLGEFRVRGNEIYAWIYKNIPYEEQEQRDKFRYVILDDDSDMLLWQASNFIHINGDVGLTNRDVYKATYILGKKE